MSGRDSEEILWLLSRFGFHLLPGAIPRLAGVPCNSRQAPTGAQESGQKEQNSMRFLDSTPKYLGIPWGAPKIDPVGRFSTFHQNVSFWVPYLEAPDFHRNQCPLAGTPKWAILGSLFEGPEIAPFL